MYFTIYWDSLLKKIVFLNEVNTVTRTEFKTVTDVELFGIGTRFVEKQHRDVLVPGYKVVSSGEFKDAREPVFFMEVFVGGKKYKSVFRVNRESLECKEVMFTELLEITIKDNTLSHVRLVGDQYQLISDLAKNRYFADVDRFARNRNPTLKDARILAASYKPQNLGFTFKLHYLTPESRIVEL